MQFCTSCFFTDFLQFSAIFQILEISLKCLKKIIILNSQNVSSRFVKKSCILHKNWKIEKFEFFLFLMNFQNLELTKKSQKSAQKTASLKWHAFREKVKKLNFFLFENFLIFS